MENNPRPVRHVLGNSCPSCEHKLQFAHPLLAKWFYEVKKEYSGVHVSHTFRGKDLQNKFFREGKTKLPYPKSKHNRCDTSGKPCSEAIDLFFLETEGIALYKDELFEKVWKNAVKHHLHISDFLKWGGVWKGFRDPCHFELELPKSGSALR